MLGLPHVSLVRAALRPLRRRGRIRRLATCATRRSLHAVRSAPPSIQGPVWALLLVIAWVPVNWVVQVVHKPAEVLAVVPSSAKAPAATWAAYGSLFTAHSTPVVTPDLLAALAQTESSGDPAARTYWRWRLSWNPFDLYAPASSAVGMFQITNGTFAEATRYCVHDHAVVETGAWNDPGSCWFNGLYSRVVPSHAVEMTAALLDRTVARTLARHDRHRATLQQRQDLAAVIHLCGSGAGDGYTRRGFRFARGQRCGAHDPRHYLARVNALKRQFARLAAAD